MSGWMWGESQRDREKWWARLHTVSPGKAQFETAQPARPGTRACPSPPSPEPAALTKGSASPRLLPRRLRPGQPVVDLSGMAEWVNGQLWLPVPMGGFRCACVFLLRSPGFDAWIEAGSPAPGNFSTTSAYCLAIHWSILRISFTS
jgi:hypothetical protein